jgi:hypothetical protein
MEIRAMKLPIEYIEGDAYQGAYCRDADGKYLDVDKAIELLNEAALAARPEALPCKKGDCDEWHRLMREITARDMNSRPDKQ